MKAMKLSFITITTLVGIYSASSSAEPNLCTSTEVEIASCELNEKKSRNLSFCADIDNKTISYRFGSRTKKELNIVFSSQAPLSRWVDTATYTVYFGFRRGEYSYVLGIPQETFGAKAFLIVTKNNKTLTDTECTDNSFGEKNWDSDSIQDVDDASVRNNDFLFPPHSDKKA